MASLSKEADRQKKKTGTDLLIGSQQFKKVDNSRLGIRNYIDILQRRISCREGPFNVQYVVVLRLSELMNKRVIFQCLIVDKFVATYYRWGKNRPTIIDIHFARCRLYNENRIDLLKKLTKPIDAEAAANCSWAYIGKTAATNPCKQGWQNKTKKAELSWALIRVAEFEKLGGVGCIAKKYCLYKNFEDVCEWQPWCKCTRC